MEAFCQKHEAKIAGVLSCFDRMLFRGYLPIMSGASMAQFLQSERVNCENLPDVEWCHFDRVPCREERNGLANSCGAGNQKS